MSVLLVKSGGAAGFEGWRSAFAEAMPELELRFWDDPIAPEAVDYVMVWDPEPGRLAEFPNLRIVFSSAAGVDNITRDPIWPRHLPLVRMGGAETSQRMGEFIAWACLSLLRSGRRMALAQARAEWNNFDVPFCAPQRRVGIMGMGNLGAHAARVLEAIGFPVAGWSRSRKAEIESYAGAEELPAFLARTDILVCLLPSTPETAGLISASLFAQLPPGAALVNAGRGSHVVLPDLLAALDSEHLSGAVLDVFDTEPLPPEAPVWAHPKVIVTPHIASLAARGERARYVAQAIRDHAAGLPLPNLFDPEKGY
ncbi:2-hydroxyacid dehydrogenase [Humitalea sp. 24SJ18S-53]|uniref:2-hydroxyacid dehydrogenase n=1 Tax=Humitalea sp. 24SJ18S-53 TaxID=3422307 RepID=UPI003D675A2B